jgi:hypothetical protein
MNESSVFLLQGRKVKVERAYISVVYVCPLYVVWVSLLIALNHRPNALD